MSASIKVFNLTDVPTPLLEQHKAANVSIAVGRALVGPGEMCETADDPMTRAHLSHFVAIGALAVDSLPARYALAKEKAVAATKAASDAEEARLTAVAVQETKKGKK